MVRSILSSRMNDSHSSAPVREKSPIFRSCVAAGQIFLHHLLPELVLSDSIKLEVIDMHHCSMLRRRHYLASLNLQQSAFPAILSFCLLVALLFALPTAARAQSIGDLLVTPTRLVFANRLRSAELTLLNIGKSTATYRISFVHLRMEEDGSLKELAATDTLLAGESFADDYIRYTPRVVILEPRVAQTVRLQLRKPADLPAGEYRSHLLFRAVPTEIVPTTPTTPATGTPPAEGGGATPPAESITIKLVPIYGVSIPLIIREGATTTQISFSDTKYSPPGAKTDANNKAEPATVSFALERTGNHSSYGDITVTFTPNGGKPKVVGILNGVSVYTPNTRRAISFPLSPPRRH